MLAEMKCSHVAGYGLKITSKMTFFFFKSTSKKLTLDEINSLQHSGSIKPVLICLTKWTVVYMFTV